MSIKKEEVSLEEKMGIYEIGYFLVSSIPEEKVAEIANSLKDVIISKKGNMLGEGLPEKRPLAYPMAKKIGAKNHKFFEGFFGWFKFELSTADIVDVKKYFENSNDVLRTLLISTVKENTYLGKIAPLVTDDKVDTEKVMSDSSVDPEAVIPTVPAEEIDKSIDEMVKEA